MWLCVHARRYKLLQFRWAFLRHSACRHHIIIWLMYNAGMHLTTATLLPPLPARAKIEREVV